MYTVYYILYTIFQGWGRHDLEQKNEPQRPLPRKGRAAIAVHDHGAGAGLDDFQLSAHIPLLRQVIPGAKPEVSDTTTTQTSLEGD